MSVGQSIKHESAQLHVEGKATYIDDRAITHNGYFVVPGYHPDCVHGEVTELDVTEVLNSDGVIDVFHFEDVPAANDISPVFEGDKLLAEGIIHYYRQPLFAVVATSQNAALRARKKAKITVRNIEPLLCAKTAIERNQTVGVTREINRGRVNHDAHTIHSSLSIGGQEHFYLEGQASDVRIEDNHVFVSSSTQHPAELQHLIANVLGLKNHDVTVEVTRMGGAFGGKESQAAQWACLAAVAAFRNNAPVRCVLSRADDMVLTGKRHPFYVDFSVSAELDGVIKSTQFDLYANCGYSADLSNAVVDRAMFHCDNAYYYPSCSITGYRAKTNTVSNTAFRGFGGPQGMLACEVLMDTLARDRRIDPLELRKRNLYRENHDAAPYGQSVSYQAVHEVIEQLEVSSKYQQRRHAITEFNSRSQRLKRGIALTPVKFGISFTLRHLNQAGALMHIYNDGSIHVNHGGTEMGQGLHTKIQQIVASSLGVSIDRIIVSATRTDKVPNTSPTAASSGSDLNGHAARNAALILRQRLIEFLANKFKTPQDKIRIINDHVEVGKDRYSFNEVTSMAYMACIHLSATGYYKTPGITYDAEAGRGTPFFYYANGAACSEVIIDTQTGESQLLAVDIVHDVGNSLNPSIDIGQIRGGYIQGLGWLTNEELKWDENGRLLSNSPSTYKIPAIGDIPDHFNIALLEHPNEIETPYRSKAVGEPPIMLAISAFCAINDAISSISDYSLQPKLNAPATSEAIYYAVEDIKKRI